MADAAARRRRRCEAPKKNDGVATAAHAFLLRATRHRVLGLGRLYVLLGAVACTCVTFVVARRAPATETQQNRRAVRWTTTTTKGRGGKGGT